MLNFYAACPLHLNSSVQCTYIQNVCFTSAREQSVILLYPCSSDRLLRSQVCDQKADPWWYYYWGGGGVADRKLYLQGLATELVLHRQKVHS